MTTAKIKDLTPYARNSRTHSDEQVAQIAASIREFGFTAPVLYADGTVIAGHGRLMAAQRLQAAGHRIALPSVVSRYAGSGFVHGTAQDEAVATWEPSIDRPPAFRPDLLMLPAPRDD